MAVQTPSWYLKLVGYSHDHVVQRSCCLGRAEGNIVLPYGLGLANFVAKSDHKVTELPVDNIGLYIMI